MNFILGLICFIDFLDDDPVEAFEILVGLQAMDRHPARGRLWERAQTVAAHVMMNLSKPLTGDATHYHTDYVDPVWNKHLIHTNTIGTHIFYRFPQGREWVTVRARTEGEA